MKSMGKINSHNFILNNDSSLKETSVCINNKTGKDTGILKSLIKKCFLVRSEVLLKIEGWKMFLNVNTNVLFSQRQFRHL